MQLSNRGESEECDVLVLEEKLTEILPSSTTVDQDGLEIFKKNKDNARFRDKTNLKRKENSTCDKKSLSKNKFPRNSRHGGVECTDVPKEKVNENIMTAFSGKPSYMCYECGKVLENNDLLRVHLLNHSNTISKHRDLEHSDLENEVADSQLMVSKTLSQQDSCFPPNSNTLVSSGSAVRCSVTGRDLYGNPLKSSGNFIAFLVIGSGQQISDAKHTIPLKSSNPVDSQVTSKGNRTKHSNSKEAKGNWTKHSNSKEAKGNRTKHSNSKEAEKFHKCEICSKIFKLRGNLKRHIEKLHGQQGFKSKCNSSGSEIKENASEDAGNLVGSQVDCGQVVSNIQREESVRNKSSLLPSDFTKCASGTGEKVAFRNNVDCSSVNLSVCSNMNPRPITLQSSSTASENVSVTKNCPLPDQDNNSKSPYSCPICFKKLAKDYVKIHLSLHQDRPYSCELCKKSYLTQSHLNRHIQKSHMPKEKNLDGSSIENTEKWGIGVEVSESKRDECNVQVDDNDVCPKTDVSLVGNEQKENVNSRTLEKSNQDLGSTAVEGKNSQAGSFLRKSYPMNNVPERCSDVDIINSLDLDVVVLETDRTKNMHNSSKIRENKEKGFGTLRPTSVAPVVTID